MQNEAVRVSFVFIGIAFGIENYRYDLHYHASTKLDACDNCYVKFRGHDCSPPTER